MVAYLLGSTNLFHDLFFHGFPQWCNMHWGFILIASDRWFLLRREAIIAAVACEKVFWWQVKRSHILFQLFFCNRWESHCFQDFRQSWDWNLSLVTCGWTSLSPHFSGVTWGWTWRALCRWPSRASVGLHDGAGDPKKALPSIVQQFEVDVSKNRGKTPKMDGENNGKPY